MLLMNNNWSCSFMQLSLTWREHIWRSEPTPLVLSAEWISAFIFASNNWCNVSDILRLQLQVWTSCCKSQSHLTDCRDFFTPSGFALFVYSRCSRPRRIILRSVFCWMPSLRSRHCWEDDIMVVVLWPLLALVWSRLYGDVSLLPGIREN